MTSPRAARLAPSSSMARDLRGPGLRAYFLCEQKVGKKSLRKRGFLRTFLITGVIVFCARGTDFRSKLIAVRLPVFSVYFSVVIGSPYRLGPGKLPGVRNERLLRIAALLAMAVSQFKKRRRSKHFRKDRG